MERYKTFLTYPQNEHDAPQWRSLEGHAAEALGLYLNVEIDVNVEVVDKDTRFHERI